MLYAIHAYENIYGGLHGIEEYEVIEAETLKEADEYAYDLSCEVINSYADVMDNIIEDAESYDYETDEEYDEFIEEAINEDIAFEIHPISIETNKSLEELTNEYFNNPDDFIKEYCNIDN